MRSAPCLRPGWLVAGNLVVISRPKVQKPPIKSLHPAESSARWTPPDAPWQRLAASLSDFTNQARIIRRNASKMSDSFLVESLDRVLQIRVYEISFVPNHELSVLQELQSQKKALTDHEQRMMRDAVFLYISIHKFLQQLSDFMREYFATNLNLRAMMVVESPTIKLVLPITRVGEEFHCRICSAVVALDFVDEHSELCVAAHGHQYESLCATERLQEAADEIAAQILNHGFEIRDPNFYPIVFPCLYVYLLADVAVNVRSTEPDARAPRDDTRGDELFQAATGSEHCHVRASSRDPRGEDASGVPSV
jgi:hypothetical protein